MQDRSITDISNNYRRSVSTQIINCSHRRRVVTVGHCRPGNHNDVIVARATPTPLTGQRHILGDGGYRGIPTITTPRRDQTGSTIRNHQWRHHRRIPARVESVITRFKDWQILQLCRCRGNAINHNVQIIACPWNLKHAINYGSKP